MADPPPPNAIIVAETLTLSPEAARTRHPVSAYLLRYRTIQGRRTVLACLRRIARGLGLPGDQEGWRHIPWRKVRSPETAMVCEYLHTSECAPATYRLVLVVLRGVLREAFKLGWMTGDEFMRAAMWPRNRAKSAPAGRMLDDLEIEKLGRYCAELKPKMYGAMVLGLIGCALGGGLRRAELAELQAGALSDDGGSLRFVGKGRKEVVQPLTDWASRDLQAWIRFRERFAFTSPHMFLAFDLSRGKVRDEGMTPWQVWALLRRTQRAADVAAFTPHDLRRTYGSTLIDTSDIANAKRLMRHESAATTIGYDRRGDASARKALNSLEKWGKR